MMPNADDKPLKSAVEIAMERLRKKDVEEGVESTPLTDAQKAAIAEVRNVYDAKLAHEDVLYQSRLRETYSEEAHDMYTQEFRRVRERLTTERDAKIEKIRRGDG
jgi:hypothetical protein